MSSDGIDVDRVDSGRNSKLLREGLLVVAGVECEAVVVFGLGGCCCSVCPVGTWLRCL